MSNKDTPQGWRVCPVSIRRLAEELLLDERLHGRQHWDVCRTSLESGRCICRSFYRSICVGICIGLLLSLLRGGSCQCCIVVGICS